MKNDKLTHEHFNLKVQLRRINREMEMTCGSTQWCALMSDKYKVTARMEEIAIRVQVA